jgi:hypothetical protein
MSCATPVAERQAVGNAGSSVTNEFMMHKTLALIVGLLASRVAIQSEGATATTFQYQGVLAVQNQPAQGRYNVSFELYSDVTGGIAIAPPITKVNLAITNGLLSADLDWGAEVFDGQPRWLQVRIKASGGAEDSVALEPRQPVLTAPYSIHALQAAMAMSVTSNSVGRTSIQDQAVATGKIANGAVTSAKLAPGAIGSNQVAAGQLVRSLNQMRDDVSLMAGSNILITAQNQTLTISSPGTPPAWNLAGNADTVSGTNFLGTTDDARLDLRAHNARALSLEFHTGSPILTGGHAQNAIATNAEGAVIAGGGSDALPNMIGDHSGYSTIGGGRLNRIGTNAPQATISGGSFNYISNRAAYGVIPGGLENTVAGRYGLAAGLRAKAMHSGSFVWADASGTEFASQTNNQFSVRAQGGVRLETQGAGLWVDGQRAVAGPVTLAPNSVSSAAIVDGTIVTSDLADAAVYSNKVASGQLVRSLNQLHDHVTLVNGTNIEITAKDQTLTISSRVKIPPAWELNGNFGAANGSNFLGTVDAAPLNLRAHNARALGLAYYSDSPNLIGGFEQNAIATNAPGATIGGGGADTAPNLIGDRSSYGVIGGGLKNQIAAGATNAAIGGGGFNLVSNRASFASIPGGQENLVAGHHGFAAGLRAKALHPGAFIWADATGSEFSSQTNNQFSVRAQGGVRMETLGAGLWLDGQRVVAGKVIAESNTVSGAAIIDGSVNTSDLADGAVRSNKVSLGQLVTSLNGLHDSVLLQSGSNIQITTQGNVVTVANTARIPLAWELGGNAGTAGRTNFLGTTDAAALEFRANNTRSLLLSYTAISPVIVAGYTDNRVDTQSHGSSIGGGGSAGAPNAILSGSPFAVIGGGENNKVGTGCEYAVIGGGISNTVQMEAVLATVAGGRENLIDEGASYATISGGTANQVSRNARAASIGGGTLNIIRGNAGWSRIGGGMENTIQSSADGSAIAGGYRNQISVSGAQSFVGGGASNQVGIAASQAVISGGAENRAGAVFGTIGGGQHNTIEADALAAVVSGGASNQIGYQAYYSVISGGFRNTVHQDGKFGCVTGGASNQAAGFCSLAAGYRARALHSGSYVWSDGIDADTISTAANQYTVRSTGGARFISAVNGPGTPISGTYLAPGSGAWSAGSDRDSKENYSPAQPRQILDAVVALPVSTWNYKAQDPAIRHIGPTAQDFAQAFGVGEDPRYINQIDGSGVALAAIQGLWLKLKEKDEEIAQLKAAVAELRTAINAPKSP